MPIHNFDFHLGVDMTGREQKTHFRVLENLFRNHESKEGAESDVHGLGRALERTPGFRRLLSTGEKIYSLFHSEYDNSLFIHAGKRLYRLTALGLKGLAEDLEEEDTRRTSYAPAAALRLSGQTDGNPAVRIYDFLPERPIAAASVGKSLYFADGVRLYCFQDLSFTVVASLGTCTIDGVQITSVTEPYLPLRFLDGAPYEQRNLLTDRYRQSHTFRESDNLNCGNAPIVFTRTGKGAGGVETCRADFCIPGDFGNTLVIPATTVVDGVTCAVTDYEQSLLSMQTQYNILVLPSNWTTLTSKALINCPSIHTVRIPRSVTSINMEFFNGCAENLIIEYEGGEPGFSSVTVHQGNYKGNYTVRYCFSEICVTYGIALPEESGSIGSMFFDGKLVQNAASDQYLFYPLPKSYETDSPYTHIYVMAHTTKPPYEKTLTFNARALPYYYKSEDGVHALATTEGDLIAHGVTTGKASAHSTDAPEGQALLRGCRLLTAYDKRLFFSGLPTVPDAIFYSHEDSEGNPNPTYVGALNYMTDGERMPITGLYSAGGELCVTHATQTRGKLQTHTYDLPDTAHSLFLRLYPVKAVYSTGPVRSAAVYRGRLHILTDDGIFTYVRNSDNGYLKAKRVSGRITPAIRSLRTEEDENTPFLCALRGHLALFAGDTLYLGDSLFTANQSSSYEYEWYPQTAVGSYKDDEKTFIALASLPESLSDAFFINEENQTSPIPCESGEKIYLESEVEERTAKTFEDGHFYDHPVFCVRKSGALVDPLNYRKGGTLSPPTAAALFCGLLVFGTEDGALLAYNTDLDYESTGEKYYLCDGHRAIAYMKTFPQNDGYLCRRKRTRKASSYILLRPMTDSCPELVLNADGRSRAMRLPAAPLEFDRLNFEVLAFTGGNTAALPIPEPYDYIEKSYELFSETPFAFLALSYEYEKI